MEEGWVCKKRKRILKNTKYELGKEVNEKKKTRKNDFSGKYMCHACVFHHQT